MQGGGGGSYYGGSHGGPHLGSSNAVGGSALPCREEADVLHFPAPNMQLVTPSSSSSSSFSSSSSSSSSRLPPQPAYSMTSSSPSTSFSSLPSFYPSSSPSTPPLPQPSFYPYSPSPPPPPSYSPSSYSAFQPLHHPTLLSSFSASSSPPPSAFCPPPSSAHQPPFLHSFSSSAAAHNSFCLEQQQQLQPQQAQVHHSTVACYPAPSSPAYSSSPSFSLQAHSSSSSASLLYPSFPSLSPSSSASSLYPSLPSSPSSSASASPSSSLSSLSSLTTKPLYNDRNNRLEGFLWKKNNKRSGWQQRYFILSSAVSPACLYYYKAIPHTAAKAEESLAGVVELKGNCRIHHNYTEHSDRPHSFGIEPPSSSFTKRIYWMQCQDETERTKWLSAIASVMQSHPSCSSSSASSALEGNGGGGLSVFEEQVAGHKGENAMLKDETGDTIFKPLTQKEARFYWVLRERAERDPTFPAHFFCKYHGNKTVPGGREYIQLQNLTKGYSKPCVADFKCGGNSKGTDPTAGLVKGIKQTFVSTVTTSSSLGFRLAGMRVYRQSTGKYVQRNMGYGTILNRYTMISALLQFVSADDEGSRVRYDVISSFLSKLKEMIAWFQVQKEFLFLSASVLLLYDAESSVADVFVCLPHFALLSSPLSLLTQKF
ncbi:Kinase [Balamuthia mandrillaris]